jgi:hypothetical protein
MLDEKVRKYLLKPNLAVEKDFLLPKAIKQCFKKQKSLGDTLSTLPLKNQVFLNAPNDRLKYCTLPCVLGEFSKVFILSYFFVAVVRQQKLKEYLPIY